jgi:hypothetical protein
VCVIALEGVAALNCVIACMSVHNRGELECASRGMLEGQHACINAQPFRFAFRVA